MRAGRVEQNHGYIATDENHLIEFLSSGFFFARFFAHVLRLGLCLHRRNFLSAVTSDCIMLKL